MSTSEKPLHIDIPVKLSEVKVAFSVPALMFEGDLPASIFHLQLIENDVANWNAKAGVIAVFHTNAGHVTLNDDAYNTERMVATGNPYKKLGVSSGLRRASCKDCRSPPSVRCCRRRRSTSRGRHSCERPQSPRPWRSSWRRRFQ